MRLLRLNKEVFPNSPKTAYFNRSSKYMIHNKLRYGHVFFLLYGMAHFLWYNLLL